MSSIKSTISPCNNAQPYRTLKTKSGSTTPVISEEKAIENNSTDTVEEEKTQPTLKRSSRIQELLSTFEQQPVSSPRKTFRHNRKKLQHRLDAAIEEAEKQRALYETTLHEKTALLVQLEDADQQVQAREIKYKAKIAEYKGMKSELEEVKKENLELQKEIEKLRKENEKKEEITILVTPVDEESLRDSKEIDKYDSKSSENTKSSEVQEGIDDMVSPRTRKDVEGGSRRHRKKRRSKRDNVSHIKDEENIVAHRVLSDKVETLLERNRDSVRMISDYESLHKQQQSEIKALKHQLVSVIDMAEHLEEELNDEKELHAQTKELLERADIRFRLSIESRSYSDPPIPEADLTGPISPRSSGSSSYGKREQISDSAIPYTNKKKKRHLFKKLSGKSQKDMHADNILQLPHEKREIAAGPESKQEMGRMVTNNTPSPMAMSQQQMQRELEVLLLLGETLQAELVAEKKEHQATKRLLAEKRQQRIPHSSSKPIIEVKPEVSSEIQTKVDDIRNRCQFNEEELSLDGVQLDSYDLRSTVIEMIGLSDYFLSNFQTSPSPP